MFGNGDPNDHYPEVGFWNAISGLLRGATTIFRVKRKKVLAFIVTDPVKR